jgi:acyl carrier protein
VVEPKRMKDFQEEWTVEEVPLGENSSEADSMDTIELEMALKEWGDEEQDSRLPSAEELAAIHEASPEMSVTR